jgi:hypothetical protein
MVICDLCGEAKECLQKEIEDREYDVCSDCWNLLEQKLRGKGRTRKQETVFLPPPRPNKDREDQGPEPLPGGPPKIWGTADSFLHEMVSDFGYGFWLRRGRVVQSSFPSISFIFNDCQVVPLDFLLTGGAISTSILS